MEKVTILTFMLAILYFISVELASYVCTGNGDYIESEQKALVDFKSGIKDPNNRLSSWKGDNYCSWLGITCENGTGLVISIDLHNSYARENINEDLNSMTLRGEIRPSLVELKHLKYLDLSYNSFLFMPIPQFFGSLHNLLYLNLSGAGFSGKVPSNFGNLSNLQYLDLSSHFFYVRYSYRLSMPKFHLGYLNSLSIEDMEWLTSLATLKYLAMDYVDLAAVGSQWAEVLNRLPNLTELHLYACNLNGSIPLELGGLPNLRYLDLSLNFYLHGNISQLLSKSWRKIEFLILRNSGLYGSIPSAIGNFCNLKYLDLYDNNLDGSLPTSIKGLKTCSGRSVLPSLLELHMGLNQLMGKLPDWLGEVRNLKVLDLSSNQLEGPIPNSLWALQHLEHLDLSRNELSGNLPDSIGQLSQLQYLDASSNNLSGTLSEQHFWNLSKLEFLNMGSNSFHLNVGASWIPSFQVYYLSMGSCDLGPSFPTWLESQTQLFALNFSNSNISGHIPNWFWNFSFYLEEIDLSHNHIYGQLPSSLNFSVVGFVGAIIDLHFNLLEGPIPFSIKGVYSLDLSHNKISGSLPSSMGESLVNLSSLDLSNNQLTGSIPDSIGLLTTLESIDLSDNNLTGTIPDSTRHLTSLRLISFSRNNLIGNIPDSIGHLIYLEVIDFSMNNLIGSIPSVLNNCSHLLIIDLGNNNFYGKIPNSFGKLQLLQSLHLNHNKLSGELPSSFQNLTSLKVLDASYNKLSSEVPAWIGSALPNLMILNLRSNMFFGRFPSQLSNLSSLHVLDIAHNNLMGGIPATLGEFKAMAQENMTIYRLHEDVSTSFYEERLVAVLKGQSLEYTRALSLVVAIDLSNNNFSGGFPEGISKLFGLMVLNLSRNLITGEIAKSISMLHQLSSLDLSNNKLSGIIPSSMAALSFLEYLNLSNNNFSGEIPFTGQMTTFSELAFVGNRDLCGPPLPRKCKDGDSNGRQPDIDNKNGGYVDQWFYLSIGLGFAAGLLVPYFVLVIRKSWCETYFGFVDGIVEWLLRGRTIYTKSHPRRRV